MKITKLRHVNPEGYYVEVIARGAEEYYLRHREVGGVWIGQGAARLALVGSVTAGDLRAVLARHDPRTGQRLASTRIALPGFDVTFSAPKSVSLLWALGGSGISTEVLDAHDAAVGAAAGFLERHGCQIRRGHEGLVKRPGRGFVGAAFRHLTSRDGDPQLHTHVLIANMTEGPDGRWTALDGRAFLRHPKAAGSVYQAVLRRELVERLGVRFVLNENGTAEVAGIESPVRRFFSKRRVAIEAQLDEWGASGTTAAQAATLKTRRPKERPVPMRELLDRWEREADSIGFRADRVPRPGTPSPLVADLPGDDKLATVLTEGRATFGWHDAVIAVASHTPLGATVDEIEARAVEFLTGPNVVVVEEGQRWTTPEILSIEAAALTTAAADTEATVPTVSEATVADVIDARPTLSGEQRAMVDAVTRTPGTVHLVVGRPGSGKTFALEAARAAWERDGLEVHGACLAARAAKALQAESGIASDTLDGFLLHLRAGRLRLHARSVVVLDEAGMVGTRRLAELIERCHEATARLVLVGDPKQLPAIGPGGLFAALARRLGFAHLTENLRQRDDADRRALIDLRYGRVDEAIDRLYRVGRITAAHTPERLHAVMVDDWMDASTRGDAVMIALTRSTARHLHTVARQRLRGAGRLGPALVTVDDVEFAVGDRVMFLRNNRRIGVLNGDTGTITGADDRGLHVTVAGRPVALPHGYLAAGHLTHAYAVTAHKAQGLTCDTALLLGDEHLFAEAGYTALSRGRQTNRIYVLALEDDHEHLPAIERDPVETIKQRLARVASERTATEQLARGQGPGLSR